MRFAIVDIEQFLDDGMFREDHFMSAVDQFGWSVHEGQKVLVRGCGSAIIPPWAYMVIATRLVGIAQSVRYGNEHDHVTIYRVKRDKQDKHDRKSPSETA